jgi:hypothetical protein
MEHFSPLLAKKWRFFLENQYHNGFFASRVFLLKNVHF